MIKELFELVPKKYGQYNDLEILPYLIENNCVESVVYGTGDMEKWFIDYLKKVYNIKPDYIISDDSNNSNGEIRHINDLNKNGKYFVMVVDEKYSEPVYRKELIDKLKAHGAETIFDVRRIILPFLPSVYLYYKNNINKYEILCDELCDDESKQTLYHYLETYIVGDRYRGKTFPEEYKYWGKDDDSYSLFSIKEDEVVLNLGGCCGDTIFQYLKNHFPFKKIISVEADETMTGYIKRSINLLDRSIKEKIQVDNIYIGEENTIDSLYGEEQVSLIEMDIEGAELQALETAKNIIKNNRPILAISAYHKQDDLLVFTEFIKSNFENYIFAVRKYPSQYFLYIAGIHQNNELVLYAIPKERYNERQKGKADFCDGCVPLGI